MSSIFHGKIHEEAHDGLAKRRGSIPAAKEIQANFDTDSTLGGWTAENDFAGDSRNSLGPSFTFSSANRTPARPSFTGWNFSHVLPKATGQLLVQPKLMVGPADDQYEREADWIAKQVMNMLLPIHGSNDGDAIPVQRREEEVLVQPTSLVKRKSAGGFEADHEFEYNLSRQRGGGSPLPASLRADFEPKFGIDFSGVRVHNNEESHQLNQSIRAKAFTSGQDIFFRREAYQPDSRGGQELIAHELAHVTQQMRPSRGMVQRRTEIRYDTPQNFGYHDPANGPAGFGPFPAINANAQVGTGVTAELDVNDVIHGSGVGGLFPAALMASLNANYPGVGWVQGHLLNSNLGGLGLPSNLAPITAEANAVHSSVVEQKVKRLLYTQPAGNFELVNHGYIEYDVDAQPVGPGFSSVNPDVDYVCQWRHQLPQGAPPGPFAPPVWSAVQNFTVESRSNQVTPVVPGGWAPFGVGLGVPLGGGGAVNAAIWNIAHVNGNPAFIAAIGGAGNWNPPMNAVQVITQPFGAGLKIIGWQF